MSHVFANCLRATLLRKTNLFFFKLSTLFPTFKGSLRAINLLLRKNTLGKIGGVLRENQNGNFGTLRNLNWEKYEFSQATSRKKIFELMKKICQLLEMFSGTVRQLLENAKTRGTDNLELNDVV